MTDCNSINWKNKDYSSEPKMFKLNKPMLQFCMQLDSSKQTIKGLNSGRLYLYDYDLGQIFRWVATTSNGVKQGVSDWNQRGGIHPPNYEMMGADWFYLKNTRIIQPNQPVDDGFILYYNGSNNWKTVKNANRSQLMVHPDYQGDGTAGCIGMSVGEYKSFCMVMEHCCDEDAMIPYGINYTW